MTPKIQRILAKHDPVGYRAMGERNPYRDEAREIARHIWFAGGKKPHASFIVDATDIVFKLGIGLGYSFEQDDEGNGTRMKLHNFKKRFYSMKLVRAAAEEIAAKWSEQ